MSEMTKGSEWRTGWDADHPLDFNIKTGVIGPDEGEWVEGREEGFLYRDLGLAAATEGKMGAWHVKRAEGGEGTADWQFNDVDFQWIYVFQGSVSLRTEDGEDVTLEQGDAGYHPPYWRYERYAVSDDFEALELTAPAVFQTTYGEHAPKPEAAAGFADLKAIYSFDRPENYVLGEGGPRSYAFYRDLGTREATEGRIHMHLIKADVDNPAPEGGSGDHTHSMAQFFLPVQGWLDFTAEEQPKRRCSPGDFYMLGSRVVHDAVLPSRDYATIQMCIPAEYDTVPA